MDIHVQDKKGRIFLLWAAYYLILCALLAASFFPHLRVWGLNWWAYYPTPVALVLFVCGALAPVAVRFSRKRERYEADSEKRIASGGDFTLFSVVLILLGGALFILLRTRTHFLGDGYQILSILASDNPFIKPTEYGEALAHLWVRSLFGTGESAALLSYRVISTAAGTAFLAVVALGARRLFDRMAHRVLFVLGLASGGYMLLFFGYVENYSLFVLFTAIYTLTGLLFATGRINRWWLLPPLVITIFLHLLGLVLIPSAIYLLIANSRLSAALRERHPALKLLPAIVAAAAAVAVFWHLYTSSYFFRYAFVPLTEGRFTLEGYTLFSSKHLLDYLNLLLVLLPGLPLMIVALAGAHRWASTSRTDVRFLSILVVSALATAFVLDPKMGMPRDWDLFSFTGVALAMACYYLLLKRRDRGRLPVTAAVLAILLGWLVLIPRAGSLASAERSVAHLNNYLSHDHIKNRNAYTLLINFHERAGDDEAARQVSARFRKGFPERQFMERAKAFYRRQDFAEAGRWCEMALEKDPTLFDAWALLSSCYLALNMNDTALAVIRIADGLNPHNPITLNNLGTVYLRQGRYERAEDVLRRCMQLAPEFDKPLFSLANLHAARGDVDRSIYYLVRLGSLEHAPVEYFRMLGDNYVDRGYFRPAAFAFQQALTRGLDRVYVEQLLEQHPQLREAFERAMP